MAKKQGSLKPVLIVFVIVEALLVIISGSFQKKLEIGFESGRFVFHNVESRYELQEKITEDFQKDEYVVIVNNLKPHEIKDFTRFKSLLLSPDPVMEKIVSSLRLQTKEVLEKDDFAKNIHSQAMLLHELNEKVINNNKFMEKRFLTLLSSSDPEQQYLSGLVMNDQPLSRLDTARLHRILMENKLPHEILEPLAHLPRIYGSFKAYNFFRNVFGEAAAISAFNLLRMLLIVDLVFFFGIFFIRRSLAHHPSGSQLVIEMVYNVFDEFVKDAVGKDRTSFTPYIVTIFLFVWLCNMIGLIPVPGFMEPTRNLNVPLGLGIVAVFVVHFTAIRVKGLWGHLEHYVNPVKNPLAALDLVSEISKVVSISFRLFGNILGGAIIIVVVSSLVNYVVLPVGLNMFFGIFVGTIQAFVFTMLALTYIGVEITE
ncbi:MAG: F0F1 ATP synthase subunit A [Candidatus Cloacimonetes bacterium]|nr:F0F1 ATP synthase subunit A [Candidatus Cloacimonadota bacterium]